ncbi:MAG: Mrp/NBP35 family ATP-binding protein [Elusimicrobia bacterium]|nr:Mrp/NBP35 family ATP-binding protein [Elusimicrobiota bacterium]
MDNAEKIDNLKQSDERIKTNMSRIKKKILVLSNKGGVGKSSVAASMAFALSKKGKKVGLLDADIHGPSVAKLLGFEGEKVTASPDGIIPHRVNPDLCAVSMASFLEHADSPVIWRGPLKMGVLRQFLADVRWGELDYLIVDSPPGTGDEPLSICQLIKDLTGAVIVTTPQDVALLDSRKCVGFLRHLSTPIYGLVENMSGLVCPHCGKEIDLLGTGGGEKAAAELGIPFLGKIPFDLEMVKAADKGESFVDEYPHSEAAGIIDKICDVLDKEEKTGENNGE